MHQFKVGRLVMIWKKREKKVEELKRCKTVIMGRGGGGGVNFK